jgi:Integrase zinc binding domain
MAEHNYWKDLMTKWGVGRIAGSEHKALGKMASLFAHPYISPPEYDTVDFPSNKEILLAQQSADNEQELLQQSNATGRREEDALWIPERAVELQLRLCVEAYCRSAGHRAYEATLGAIKEYVAWTTMAMDVKVFVQNCLHCVATIPGDKVLRPLGMLLHATKLNKILHFDFLHIGFSRDGEISTYYLSRMI